MILITVFSYSYFTGGQFGQCLKKINIWKASLLLIVKLKDGTSGPGSALLLFTSALFNLVFIMRVFLPISANILFYYVIGIILITT